MRLEIVTGPVFFVNCYRCAKKVSNSPKENRDGSVLMADLDGKAFKAYYCANCVKEISKDKS